MCFSCQMNMLCCLTRSTHDHGKATCFTAKTHQFQEIFLNWKTKKLEISSIDLLPELILLHKMKLSAKKLTTEAMFSSRSLSPLLSESDVSVRVNYNKSEELEEELH